MLYESFFVSICSLCICRLSISYLMIRQYGINEILFIHCIRLCTSIVTHSTFLRSCTWVMCTTKAWKCTVPICCALMLCRLTLLFHSFFKVYVQKHGDGAIVRSSYAYIYLHSLLRAKFLRFSYSGSHIKEKILVYYPHKKSTNYVYRSLFLT